MAATSLISVGLPSFAQFHKMVSLCGRLNSDPKYVHILIPRTRDMLHYVAERMLHMYVIKLRTLSWRDFPGLSEWAPCKDKGPESEK